MAARDESTGADGRTASADAAGESVRERLERESGVLLWSELARHFARGVVVVVAPRADLLDVAACLAEDDTHRLQAWIDSGAVARASDDDARDWSAREPSFRCVVVAPWVVVQELPSGVSDSG